MPLKVTSVCLNQPTQSHKVLIKIIMRIFVTGAAGFVAEHLIPELHRLGHRVIGCDRKPAKKLTCEEYIQCDLADKESYINEFKNVDFIIHLAAARADWGVSRSEFIHDNLQATETLIEASLEADIKSWLFVSSVSTIVLDFS